MGGAKSRRGAQKLTRNLSIGSTKALISLHLKERGREETEAEKASIRIPGREVDNLTG